MLAQRFKSRREKRKYRLRFTIKGTTDRPRLSVFRSTKHIYAQVIDDSNGRTLASASSLEVAARGVEGSKKDVAEKVGELITERAIAAGVQRLVFDRNGFLYTGRVAAVSKAAHAAGLLSKEGLTGETSGDDAATGEE
jgi:large subunit ribosomal protein L18